MSKQKIVIGVPMENAKKRSKALKVVVEFPGVQSVEIDGADKAQIVVVGEGVDSVTLTKCLRKKMGGHAQIITVGAVEEKKEDKKIEITPPVVLPPLICYDTPHGSDNACTIM